MAARFWVGGSGNWSDATNHWATSSGGAPGAGNLPTSADDVTFDAASSGASYTATIDSGAVCKNFNVAAQPATGVVTIAGGFALTIAGNFTLLAGMTWSYNGNITFNGAGVIQILTTNGVGILSNVNFSTTSSGTCRLGGPWTHSGPGAVTYALTAGTTFDPNGFTVTFSGTAAQTITLSGSWTFQDLTFSSGAVKTTALVLAGNVSVAGTFIASGNSAINRAIVQSSVIGASRTITAAVASLTNADFRDVALAQRYTAPYAYFPGTTGQTNRITTPDTAGNSIAGDFDIRADLTLENWASAVFIAAKDDTGVQRSWWFGTQTGGALNLSTTTDGSSGGAGAGLAISSAVVGFAAGARRWVRATRVAATGVVTFYTSTDGSNWTQLGTTQSTPAGALFDSNKPIQIGSRGDALVNAVYGPGAIHRVQVLSGIGGTTAIDFNPALATQGASSFVGAGGETWTVGSTTAGTYVVPSASWAGSSLGDCLGNSGITFTPSVTQTATGTASFTWSTHGWTTRVPLPQDDVIIPNAFVAGRTITADMPRLGRSLTFTCTGNPQLTPTSAFSVFGSVELASGMTTSTGFAMIIEARTSVTVRSNGVAQTFAMQMLTPGITVTLLDALSLGSSLVVRAGTFNDAGFSVTVASFDSQLTTTRVVNKSGLWTITGSVTPWVVNATGLTFNDTGTIKFTDASAASKIFSGGSLTYNNLWFSGGGSGAFQMTGSNTFNNLRVDPGLTLNFTAGTTTTVSSLSIDGVAGTPVTIGSTTASNHTLTKAGGGRVQCNYVSVSRSSATPANTFYAANSTDGGNNSGWIFGAVIGADARAMAIAPKTAQLLHNRRIAAAARLIAISGQAASLPTTRIARGRRTSGIQTATRPKQS